MPPNTQNAKTLSSLNSLRRPYQSRSKAQASEADASAPGKNGRWSLSEHLRFLEALKLHGKNWKNIEEHIATRTSTQARSHAQKFFGNISNAYHQRGSRRSG
ncbi:hypothetical protein FGO68_gene10702 [Halteria grandinella]|uniref:Uncharacterized protein n=1 Tax=Halteria grandinella TaxID=5974 RepID=A0A8J8NXV2_HALGN|nr:hypothetical protein FGO68_gene10702 [Halteria grandinella]